MIKTSYRELAPGIGEAVAKRTYFRTTNGVTETWGDVADRVAKGNSMLLKNFPEVWSQEEQDKEYETMKKLLANGSLLMSGRHLQHGDETQIERNQEIFTNCSTTTASFILYYLLLNGSGVGRSYDDDLMIVDWGKNLPYIKVVLDNTHKDFKWDEHEDVNTAKKKYPNAVWYEVDDSREGWARAVELIETLTWQGNHFDKTLVLDFSKIRPSGTPIKGMQNRPASGPVPTMKAILNIASLKGSSLPVWEQTLWVDHYLAESVLVGGARRSARIATKSWMDKDILGFVRVKKGGFLWSANNSVAVDDEFWKLDTKEKQEIFEEICKASYFDNTGEPGFINQHKLVQNDEGLSDYSKGEYVGSKKFKPQDDTKAFLSQLANIVQLKKYYHIVNPCGEVSLNTLGGYCVIADVVPYHAVDDDEAEEAFRMATRALIRVNSMDALFDKETRRTNRIGVGITGIHEYAWKRFGYGWKDLVDEDKSKDFWMMLGRFKDAVADEAEKYSKYLGLNIPHTNTTIKPSGTISKLFALSEGAHLPAMKEYMRWVQFRSDDPLLDEYRKKHYPVRDLKIYKGATIVGFPTRPEICNLGMGDKLVTAAEATPEEQYKWLMLLEKYYMKGINQTTDTGNQVSYTLKYKPDLVSYEDYKETTRKYQSLIRCCSVMPQIDATAYEYQPEEPISLEEYNKIEKKIRGEHLSEDIDMETLRCAGGACPI